MHNVDICFEVRVVKLYYRIPLKYFWRYIRNASAGDDYDALLEVKGEEALGIAEGPLVSGYFDAALFQQFMHMGIELVKNGVSRCQYFFACYF